MARSLLPLAALLLLAPTLAGCTLFDGPPPGAGIDPRVVQEAYVVEDLALRLNSPYGNLRAEGRVIAVPLQLNGTEFGAAYLNASVSWRADAIFQARERVDVVGDLFVESPAGAWPGVRAGQGWRPADAADLAALGLPDALEAFRRAAEVFPAELRAPAPDLWVVNGTVAATVKPDNVTLATEEGPFIFQRDASGFITIENRTVIRWTIENRSLLAQQDAVFSTELFDEELTEMRGLSWSSTRVDIRIVTPSFREADLQVDEDRVSKVFSATLPGIAQVTMIGFERRTVRDDFVEIGSRNMTLVMAPG